MDVCNAMDVCLSGEVSKENIVTLETYLSYASLTELHRQYLTFCQASIQMHQKLIEQFHL
jgi:hypothetical protein